VTWPLLWLANVTVSGAVPLVGVALNAGTGAVAGTTILTSLEYGLSRFEASYAVTTQ
jgi:hypothetical protein